MDTRYPRRFLASEQALMRFSIYDRPSASFTARVGVPSVPTATVRSAAAVHGIVALNTVRCVQAVRALRAKELVRT